MRKAIILFSFFIIAVLGCQSNSDIPVVNNKLNEDLSAISEVTGTAVIKLQFPQYDLSERTSSERPAINNLRASAQAPYVQAQLFVDDKLTFNKTAAVVNGAIEIAFTGVVNAGLARVELNFVGCHIHGATKFSGASQISQQTVISVKPIWPDGAIVTSDGRLLREIGTQYAIYGRVFSGKNLTFTSTGEPVGFTSENYLMNYKTGQKFFTRSELRDANTGFGANYIVWHAGNWYAAGNNMVYVIPGNDISTKRLYAGSPSKYGMAVDGSKLLEATFEAITDIVSANGRLYIVNSVQQIVDITDPEIKVMSFESISNTLSVTEHGRIFLCGVGVAGGAMSSVEVFNNGTTQQIHPADPKYPSYSIIEYGDKLAVSVGDKIMFCNGGAFLEDFVVIPTQYGLQARVYKNQNGAIYIVSDSMGKIWEVL